MVGSVTARNGRETISVVCLNCFDALLHDSITLQIRINMTALRFFSTDGSRTSKVLNGVVSLSAILAL